MKFPIHIRKNIDNETIFHFWFSVEWNTSKLLQVKLCLTRFRGLKSASLSNRSRATSVWPICEAKQSAVSPCYTMKTIIAIRKPYYTPQYLYSKRIISLSY